MDRYSLSQILDQLLLSDRPCGTLTSLGAVRSNFKEPLAIASSFQTYDRAHFRACARTAIALMSIQ
ncbi:MAG: hypothetical protein HC780_28420 [Leptolyngbyaceae cyanobacterium CSU_1_3]|nr:hypothetical protein [Leptolyngbyaceae cyanobacterium CSU_1_3]